MSCFSVMRVRRDKEGPRVSAAPVHFDPADLGTDATQEECQPGVWVDACSAAGLLPDGPVGDTPASPTTDDGDEDEATQQKPTEHSTVAVFKTQASRFPMVPVARGFLSTATNERVWVGATSAAGSQASEKVYVAHYGRLSDQVHDEVSVAEGGAGMVETEPKFKTASKKTTKKQWKPPTSKMPAKAKKKAPKKKGMFQSDSESSIDFDGLFD